MINFVVFWEDNHCKQSYENHLAKMASKNDITGDSLVTKNTNDSYRDGWDRIFNKDKTEKEKENEEQIRDSTEKDG